MRIKAIAVAMFCVCLLLGSIIPVTTAFAAVSVFFNSKPGLISNDATPTFSFIGMDMGPFSGDIECKIDSEAFDLCASPYTVPSLAAGDHTFTIHAVGESNPSATESYTWNINQSPTFSGGTSVSGVAGVPIAVTDLQIDDADNDMLGVLLSVPSGTLKLGTTTGITFSGSSTGSNVAFSGTRTNLNTALTTLTYTPSSAGTVDIDAVLTGAVGGTRETLDGHFYQMVGSTANWSVAKAAAEASVYGGMNGYLATVTSAGEKTYLQDRMSDGMWIGASDATSEGNWRWMGGPENGTVFWSGGLAVGGAYTNWQFGQPDDFGGNEDCLEMRFNASESWNDENCGSSRGYIIEYGDNSALPSLATAQVSASALAASGDVDGDGLSNAVEASAPNGGDANNDGSADYTQANVSSHYSSISNSYVVIQTGCTANQQVQLSAESLAQKDPAYDYPYGLAGFMATGCGSPGATTIMTQYYYGMANPSALTLRKWNSTTGVYSTVGDAVLSSVTIADKQAVEVVYQVIDGGILDQDGIANGSITDPVGLATTVIQAPNAGFERQDNKLFISGILGSGLLIIGTYVLRRIYKSRI